ncbi:MAG: hypothetical protein ACI9S8_000796 [Chlamydiales bacterium]|jgi:hypothetical protein
MNFREGFNRVSVVIGRVAALLFLYLSTVEIFYKSNQAWVWVTPSYQSCLILIIYVTLSCAAGWLIGAFIKSSFDQIIWVFDGFVEPKAGVEPKQEVKSTIKTELEKKTKADMSP